MAFSRCECSGQRWLCCLLRAQSSQECPTGTRGPGIPITSPPLSPSSQRPAQVPVHPSTPLSSHTSSIHPSTCQAVAGPSAANRREPPSGWIFSYEGPSQSCQWALSGPGVPRQLNLSSGQSEESGSRPISLHYGTALLRRCHVPVVLQGRCCLIHHQGTKGLAGGGWGEEVGPSCPWVTHTHTYTHIHFHPLLKFHNHQPSSGERSCSTWAFLSRLFSKMRSVWQQDCLSHNMQNKWQVCYMWNAHWKNAVKIYSNGMYNWKH